MAGLCLKCQVVVKDLSRHKRRNRCAKQQKKEGVNKK
jgi:hypothetical protein